MIHAFIMEYRPLLAFIKGLLLYYKACIKRVCFVRIDLALCG
ncbi:hypothetical protein HMPREF1392_00046 [Helicobacter pylori GAM101Biv]|nr:hypothetical protein HMPREF1392_00046 [Helicobacter pylori GAM101Biv]